MNIFDLRMSGFSTETAVCLQTLHYSVLIGDANEFYAQMIHIFNYSEAFTKSTAFQESIRLEYIPFRNVVRNRQNILFWGDILW